MDNVTKKVDDERFVGKTGKVFLKKSVFKTKHKPRAENDTSMYASDPVLKKCKLITHQKILNTYSVNQHFFTDTQFISTNSLV